MATSIITSTAMDSHDIASTGTESKTLTILITISFATKKNHSMQPRPHQLSTEQHERTCNLDLRLNDIDPGHFLCVAAKQGSVKIVTGAQYMANGTLSDRNQHQQ